MTEIDAERQRFLVSLKPSECCSDKSVDGSPGNGVELLENYLLERQKIVLQLAASSGILTISLPESVMEQTFMVVLTFESVDEILWCDLSNETSSAVLSPGTICFVAFEKLNLGFFLNF